MNYLKTLVLFVLTVITTSCISQTAEKPQQTDEEAIAAVEEVIQKLFDEVWAGYDETAIEKYQTKDFLLLEHGEVWNNDSIVNWCKRSQARTNGMNRVNDFERIDARRDGDKLWLAYQNNGTFKKDSTVFKLGWLESVVAVKEDSIWKLELMHSTRQSVK